MAVAASGSQVKWYYAIEDGSGDISATIPEFTPIRFNTSDLTRDTAQVDSEEINQERQREKSRQGTYSIAGSIVANMSYGSHDALIEAGFQSSFSTDVLIVGSTVPTISLLRRNTDTSVDVLYRHCRVADLSFNIVLNASATLTCGLIGESQEIYTVPGSSTWVAETTTEMMVPTIGYMNENASALTYLTDYTVNFSNGMSPLFSLFQRGAYSVENGVFTAGGSMSAYQPDATLMTKFIDETATSHEVKLLDLAGNYYLIELPDVIYTQLSDPVSGPGAHIHAYTFSGGYDGSTTATITRVPI